MRVDHHIKYAPRHAVKLITQQGFWKRSKALWCMRAILSISAPDTESEWLCSVETGPILLLPQIYLSLQRNELRQSRMELLTAQDEARVAREEARHFRAELSASQAELTKVCACMSDENEFDFLLPSKV